MLHTPQPITKDELNGAPLGMQLSEDELQMQADLMNIEDGTVDFNSFSEEHREKLKSYYRYYGHRYGNKHHYVANRIRSVLDVT
jgi:hypothetical protein